MNTNYGRGKPLMGGLKKRFIFWGFFYTFLSLMGCGEPDETINASDYVIKTPLMMITSKEFLEELDLKRAAYPYTIHENPAEYNEMVVQLVEMLSQESLLLTAAADKGVIVTDQEVTSAEEEFKKDYPDNSFDQILLENAISYFFWKKRFKKNMIMNKLIDQELKSKVNITSQDIVAFYKKNNMADSHSDRVHNKIKDEKELVFRLRLQKTEDLYDEWIRELGKVYLVEINTEKLKTFLIDIEKSKENKNEN